ncbi:MAG: DUF5666 domain-containing protein [Ktedonobacteraceae bacterium]
MQKISFTRFQGKLVGIAAMAIMLFVSACAGTGTGTGQSTTSTTTNTSTTSTTPVQQPTTQSSSPTVQAVAFKAGGISFIGPVKSITSSSLVMSAPNGQTYTMTITAQTDRSAYGGTLPAVGASVNMDSTINPDGSLTATILKPAQPSDPDLNNIAYTGITTSPVGVDRVLHFTAGTKSYTFTIPATADLSDFSGNAQAIVVNTTVKVKVAYPANTIVSVGNAGATTGG